MKVNLLKTPNWRKPVANNLTSRDIFWYWKNNSATRNSLTHWIAIGDVVSIGSHVKVQEDGESTAEEYFVVGSAEADPSKGKISNESPLARALLGKRVGDQAVVQAPAGDIVFKVIAVF